MQTNNNNITSEFVQDCIAVYTEREIPSKKLGKLTPYEIAIAILVELSLLSQGETVFEKTVYALLKNLPVGNGTYNLDIEGLVAQYIQLCWLYEDTEFAQASFNSLYKTWTDKDNFDRNYNLTGKEAHLLADDTNLSQLLKAWIFFMSEHHNRFFYTYDPRCSETSKAYYTVLGDSTKHKRSCSDFVDYLSATRPIFAKMCMISSDKSEIHKVFSVASAESKAFFEKRRAQRDAKRAAALARRQKKAPAPAPAPPAKPVITLAERRRRLDEVLQKYQEMHVVPVAAAAPAPVASVWKKPETKKVEPVVEPAKVEPVVEPAKVEPAAEPEDDGFTEVKSKPKKVQHASNFERKVAKGRSYRLFKEE